MSLASVSQARLLQCRPVGKRASALQQHLEEILIAQALRDLPLIQSQYWTRLLCEPLWPLLPV